VSQVTNRNGDIHLALASIAAEFRVELDVLPDAIRDRVVATLRALSNAHYHAGVRDTMVRFGNVSAALRNENVASSTDVTPIVGPHGRKLRASKLPTPLIPPPQKRGQNDDEGGGKRKK
jgi:hypothetical protein